MSGYIGNIPVPQATQTRQTFTATASQTTFNTAGYTAGFVDVYMNGVHLLDGTDYTATNGSDVVLTSGAAAGDVIEVVAYSTYQVNSQNYTGGVTVDNDAATVLTVDRATSDGTIVDLQKDGSTAGSIGVDSSTRLYFTNSTGAGLFLSDGTQVEPMNNGSRADNAMSLGGSVYRFKDLYLSGGVYLGGTGSANYLDDYEEGTWTPSLAGATGEAYGTRQGFYTKIGNQVTCQFYMQITTAPTGGSNVYIALPFTPNGSVTGIHGGNLMRYDGMNLSTRSELYISPYNGSANGFIYRGDGNVFNSISHFKIGVISAAFTYTT